MKSILKTIIIAKLVALLITGLTFFMKPAMTMGGFNFEYVVTYPGTHLLWVFSHGFPIEYFRDIGSGYVIYPIAFIIDFLIFFAACLAIIFVINEEWKKHGKERT